MITINKKDLAQKLVNARGTEFKYLNDCGEIYNAFVAGAEINIGLTVKDINNNDPDSYLFCWDMQVAKELVLTKGEDLDVFMQSLDIALNMINTKEVFDEEKYLIKIGNEETGGGDCPF